MDRRHFLQIATSVGMIAAVDGLVASCGTDDSNAGTSTAADVSDGSSTTSTAPPTDATSSTGATTTPVTTTSDRRQETTRYGPLAATPDPNGLLLPAGFTSELLAAGGQRVAGTDYRWHIFADGGACFALDDGGWVYANNSEVPVEGAGGAGALRFDADGRVVDAYSILEGTTWNCAGGATPWETWLSCEEIPAGQVWECDPLGQAPAQPRPAMGMFRHEAVAADTTRRVLYLSEDEPDGLLYRFRPRTWGDLSEGELEALAVSPRDGAVSWVPVRGIGEPGRTLTRYDAPGATALPGGEGIALDGDILYLATKGDNRISRLDLNRSRFTLYWEGPPLEGPDNLAVHDDTGNLYVCEDAGNMEVVLITPDGQADPFLRFVGHDGSEVTGAAFDPTGTRLMVNSQRAPTPPTFDGSTYMISGPF
ncbi:MAG TPA: alkaline phosphatase PhoX [Ilumatobacteraceae bacterium]|nr:alkaline phosphatase PhoX [Ilumatobacteraceae bacterium]